MVHQISTWKKGASQVSCFSYLARKTDYFCCFRRTSMSAAQGHAAKQHKPLIVNSNYAFHSSITCNTQRKTQKVILRKIERAILSINVCQQLWSLWRTMIWSWQTDDSRNVARVFSVKSLLRHDSSLLQSAPEYLTLQPLPLFSESSILSPEDILIVSQVSKHLVKTYSFT